MIWINEYKELLKLDNDVIKQYTAYQPVFWSKLDKNDHK